MAASPQDEASRVTLEAWLVTDVGVVREHNEDSAFMEPLKGFFIVADGMGGHAAGEVASAMAVDTVRRTLENSRPEIERFRRAPTDAGRRSVVQLLQNAVLSAHQAVFQRGQHEADKAGMGTTLDVVLISGPEAFVAHVGDSRTYLIRDGRSSQITTDHTVAEVLVIEGKLTIEEAQISPLRTILVNAIGVSADVGVEMAHVTLKRGDRLLLCSDGLHDYFPTEEEIAQKLSTGAPGDALRDMVELAKTRGGHDNITGVAVLVTDVFEAAHAQIDGEATHPGEIPGVNPFASDEPTETATLEPGGLLPRVVSHAPAAAAPQLKATQPMRVVPEESEFAASPAAPSSTAPRDDGSLALDSVPVAALSAGDTMPHALPEPDAGDDSEASSASGVGARPEAHNGAVSDGRGDPRPDGHGNARGDAKIDPASDDTIDAMLEGGPEGSESTPAAAAGAKPAGDPAPVTELAVKPGASPAEIEAADTGPAGASPGAKGAKGAG